MKHHFSFSASCLSIPVSYSNKKLYLSYLSCLLIPDMFSENIHTSASEYRWVSSFYTPSPALPKLPAYGYNTMVKEFPNEAEAYWGLVLCRYGIEYVEDPRTKKMIPTCHRTIPKPIFDDSDYQLACQKDYSYDTDWRCYKVPLFSHYFPMELSVDYLSIHIHRAHFLHQ